MDYKHLQKFIKENKSFFDVKIIGKSVLGKNIYAINKEFNKSYRWCIISGSIHAREHLSCDLLCHFMKKLEEMPPLPYNVSFVPLVNPDGVDFAVNGIDKCQPSIQEKLIKINGGRDFSLYKANANGVDLNNNFCANWNNKFTKVFTPAPQGYYGPHHESEPEVRALVAWTKTLQPFLTLSYHLKGEQIYFDFFQERQNYKRDKSIAKIFHKSTGYKIKSTQKVSSGGYKDWCVSHLKIPALTIELGNDKFSHPFPQTELEHICTQNDNIFVDLTESLTIYTAFLNKKIKTMHIKNMNYKICDTHNDFLTELPIEKIKDYIKQCQKDRVEKICASYWSTKKNKNKIFEDICKRTEILRSVDAKFLLHIEDLWWVQDENTLEKLIELKPFSCSLTWNNQNLLAGGTLSKGGLTDWGRTCLLKLSECGVVIDTAHLNRQSFCEVTEILPQKIYCSHTGFCGIKKHKRNLTDRQIDTIVRSNGFIGLFFYDKCVQTSPNFLANDIINNLNYFTSRWGFDNIGIGSDFYGIEKYPENLRSYRDFQNLANLLLLNGYTNTEIQKIFYQNFIDFIKN